MIYDIFYVSRAKIYEQGYQNLRKRFPTVQKIEDVKTFDDIKNKSFTKFFWVVWDDTVVNDEFDFSYRVSEWDNDYIHVFKSIKNDVETYIGGVTLFPKNSSITQKEFDHRFYINKKELDIVASRFKYPIYQIKSYDEYLEITKTINHPLFWNVPFDVEVTNTDIFNIYFDPQDGKFDYDRNENHVFKNGDWFDGVMLFSTGKILSKKEFDYRFPASKKEWEVQASRPKPYDIVFISYKESNADENFKKLKDRFPKAKRIDGIKGIHSAHLEAAKIAETKMFWVVDADAIIVDDFNFEIEYYPYYDAGNRAEQLSTVFVWTSKNPINDLEYGYGGVKLLPRQMTLDMKLDSVDMTTSISNKFKSVNKISNITAFNTDEFSTWKSAFRECVKLASKVIDRKYQLETEERLKSWCRLGKDKPYGEYAIAGAKVGLKFGKKYISNPSKLAKINDFDWIYRLYNKCKISYERK